MQDIVQKVDRAKVIYAKSEPTQAEQVELASLATDLVVELIVNSRRIAVALEKVANRLEPPRRG